MKARSGLQRLLEETLGSRNVYFQPPASIRMNYPAIVYERNLIETDFADDNPYRVDKGYRVTHIDANPDSIVPDKLAALPMAYFERHYTADNLNHDVFIIHW